MTLSCSDCPRVISIMPTPAALNACSTAICILFAPPSPSSRKCTASRRSPGRPTSTRVTSSTADSVATIASGGSASSRNVRQLVRPTSSDTLRCSTILPRSRITTDPHSSSMSCRLCELTMNVRSLSSDRIRLFIADAVAGSRPAVGSSSSTSSGAPRNACAIAMRFNMPWLSVSGVFFATSASSTSCSTRAASARAAAAENPCSSASIASWLCTGTPFTNAASWGRIATRPCRSRCSGGRPSTSTVPRVGRRNPHSTEKNVVLPAPFGPTRPIGAPASSVRSMRSSARVPPKSRPSPSVLTIGAAAIRRPACETPASPGTHTARRTPARPRTPRARARARVAAGRV